MAPFSFAKYEGLGNDFILIETDDEDFLGPQEARRLCDRRLGIGADGVLLVLPARTREAEVRMKVVNADGSVPEMCGNGLRCVAIHTKSHGDVVVETDAGLRRCSIAEEHLAEVRSDFCRAVLVTAEMGRVQTCGVARIAVLGEDHELFLADAGNPHAVLFTDQPKADALRLGLAIATHAVFPGGTNVEFATVEQGAQSAIDLVVWERGVGLTLACGTGACATVAVAWAGGMLPSGETVDVRLPGGVLAVSLSNESGQMTLRGPARKVFEGRTVTGRDAR